MKKCRARYGLDQQSQWCKPCRSVNSCRSLRCLFMSCVTHPRKRKKKKMSPCDRFLVFSSVMWVFQLTHGDFNVAANACNQIFHGCLQSEHCVRESKDFFRPWVKKRAKNLTDIYFILFSFLLDNERLMFPFFYISQCLRIVQCILFKLDLFRCSVSAENVGKCVDL